MIIKKINKIKSVENTKKKYVRFCPKCNSGDIGQDKSTMQSLGYLPTKYICNNCGYSSFNFPEIDVNEVDKLDLQKPQDGKISKNQSELVDTSYGKFYVRVWGKITGPFFLISGLIYLYLILSSDYYDNFDFLFVIGLLIVGVFICYISFSKNSEVKNNQ